MKPWLNLSLLCVTMLPVAAWGADPSAAELLKQYDAALGSESFEASFAMSARREDGTARSYKLKVAKAGADKLRLWFLDPASAKGQEMLRQGDSLWVYMPNLKRSLRVAARDAFQGGDFNNADLLRASYQADYTPTLGADNDVSGSWLLELQAKSAEVAYDRIKLWLRKGDFTPLKAEYYTQTGKMLRAAEFSEVKQFGGLKRPAKVVMKNMLATERSTTLVVESFNAKAHPAASQFTLEDLGR